MSRVLNKPQGLCFKPYRVKLSGGYQGLGLLTVFLDKKAAIQYRMPLNFLGAV